MKFYLVDKNKVLTYFELHLVNGKVELPLYRDFSIVVHNVKYAIRESSLEVLEVTPANENALVLTTDGLVKWHNPSRRIFDFRDKTSTVFNHIYDYNHVYLYDLFCSGFICLGSLPSEKAFKINPSDLRAYNEDENQIYSLDDAGFKIYETDDSLIIYKSGNKSYKVGVVIKEKMYIFSSFPEGNYNYIKEIVPKGTCFETDYIVDLSEKTTKRITNGTYYELCY